MSKDAAVERASRVFFRFNFQLQPWMSAAADALRSA
jgi:hypothetical protein